MKTEAEELVLNENEEFNSERNILTCFECDFQTENIDELDDHILANHDVKDDALPEEKFQIVNDEETPVRRTRKRKASDRPKNLPKNIPRAKIIVKKHDPKFKLCDPKETTSKLSINPTPKRVRKAASEPMHCHLCEFVTTKKSVLATHMLNHSDVIPPIFYKCSQCPYQTKRKNDMPKHMLGHCSNDTVPLYKCKSCPYVTKRKGDLPKHEMNHVDRNQVFSWNCTECEYFSKRKNDLHKHMLIHSDRQLTGLFKCLKCAYATNKVVKFSRHVLSKCVCWDDPISLEHLMLEDILASVEKSGVHVLLNEDSDEEQTYVEEEVQYIEGNVDENAEFVHYVGHPSTEEDSMEGHAVVTIEEEAVEDDLFEENADVDTKEAD